MTTDKFAKQEVRSNYKYPEEYKGAKPINEQVKAIAEIFGLNPSTALKYIDNLPQLPEGAEGWFAIPRVSAVSEKYFPELSDSADIYCRVVEFVLTLIGRSRSICHCLYGQIRPTQFRVSAQTAQSLDLIADKQPGDILIIAAQLGLRHRGRSVKRTREVLISGEFGLGAFAAGTILLTHPERELDLEQLHFDCPGDEFAQEVNGSFSFTPFFCSGFSDSILFNKSRFDRVNEYYGSASAFVS